MADAQPVQRNSRTYAEVHGFDGPDGRFGMHHDSTWKRKIRRNTLKATVTIVMMLMITMIEAIRRIE